MGPLVTGPSMGPDPHHSQKSLVEAGGSIHAKTNLYSAHQCNLQGATHPYQKRLAYVAGVTQCWFCPHSIRFSHHCVFLMPRGGKNGMVDPFEPAWGHPHGYP